MSFFFSKKNATAQEDETQDALVALDIGSSKIRLIAGEVNEDGFLSLTYYAECHSEGVVNGAITDLTKLSHQIALLVADYKENGRDLTHCYIGIAGRYIKSANLQGGTVVPTHAVTEADREHAIENAAANRFSEYQRIIHIIPQSYQIGDTREIVNPIDLSAQRLDVSIHAISCDEDQEQNLRRAISMISSDISVDHVIYNGIAAADAVLSEEDKAIGVCLVDWGGGAINVALYDKSCLIHTFGLDYGGARITREIATRFGLPLGIAEYLKRNYGVAHPKLLPEKDKDMMLKVPLDPRNPEEVAYIAYKDLANVIAYSMIDTLQLIQQRIETFKRSQNMRDNFGSGYVFTGGVPATPGFEHLATSKLAVNGLKPKIRVGKPRSVQCNFNQVLPPNISAEDLSENVLCASGATAIGLLRFGYALKEEEHRRYNLQNDRRHSDSTLAKIYHWGRNWLSGEL